MNGSRIQRTELAVLLVMAATLASGCQYLVGIENTLRPPTGDVAEPPIGDVSSPAPDDISSPPTGDVVEPEDDAGNPDATIAPTDPFGPAEATYHTGTASIRIGKDVITLDRLASPGTYFKEFGADVIWTGADGWYVQLGGAKANIGPVDIPAYLAFDRVHDGQHWVSWDPDGCKVTIKKADRGGVSGTATCKNMRWVDAIATSLAEEPTPIPGQPAFSATVTFRATP